MKLFLSAIFAFACVAELCGASRLDEAYKYHEKVTEIPNETIEKFKSGVLGIKGIGSQAADDLVNVATELKRDLPAYLFYTNTVELLWKEMNAKNNVLNATHVEQYFIDHTEPHTGEEMDKLRAEYNEFCTELETILAQKMQPEQFNRIKTLLRIFLGTKKQIEAGLDNLYQPNQENDSRKTVA